LIDECHLVNAKGGMYEKLITSLAPDRLIGMTATPYRLSTTSYGSQMRIQCRTRPKLFENILHVSNPCDLLKLGFLLNPEFADIKTDTRMLTPNSSGAEYSEHSVDKFMRVNSIRQQVINLAATIDHKHILIFSESVEDSDSIVADLIGRGIRASTVNAKTPKKPRAEQIAGFMSGAIKVMVNVGTLTTGFDFPALDCIIDSCPTMSAGLHYQKIGRVVRPFPGKKPVVYDLAGNHTRLGNPLNYTMLPNSSGNYEVYSERGRITTRIISADGECETKLTFGKHSGKSISALDDDYIEWAAKEMNGDWKHVFYAEKIRRELFVK